MVATTYCMVNGKQVCHTIIYTKVSIRLESQVNPCLQLCS